MMLKKFVLLFPLFLTACDDVKLALINTDIESPVRNTCQSADLDKDFPKCEENFHENASLTRVIAGHSERPRP